MSSVLGIIFLVVGGYWCKDHHSEYYIACKLCCVNCCEKNKGKEKVQVETLNNKNNKNEMEVELQKNPQLVKNVQKALRNSKIKVSSDVPPSNPSVKPPRPLKQFHNKQFHSNKLQRAAIKGSAVRKAVEKFENRRPPHDGIVKK